jgi:multiple sugar transport system ATP-binding protein
VRPEHVVLGKGDALAEVLAVEPLGAETHVVVRVDDLDVRAQSRGFDAHRRGDRVLVSIDAARAMLFDAEAEGRRIA